MSIADYLIVIIPVLAILTAGFYSRKYIRSVADYLAAGRICGRYVLSSGDIANAISVIGLIAYVEICYKTGFALSFWQHILLPVVILSSLFGYCTYRFRETKAMSLGQFLEMRYSRNIRIFASTLRATSEIIGNMIMPAVAARFFMYFLNLPNKFSLFGLQFDTYLAIIVIILFLAISILYMGGALMLVITGALQGMLLCPLLLIFIIWVLSKFSWGEEIVPVMMDRVSGESFINPYDINKLRDFNLVYLIYLLFYSVFHRASWISGGVDSAAKNPHEQKMAGLLGAWRSASGGVVYLLLACVLITFLNHKNFSAPAREVRIELSNRIANEVIDDENIRNQVIAEIKSIPQIKHQIGVDKPLSHENNLDTVYLEKVHETLKKSPDGNSIYQEFKTLYHQLTLATTMRNLLPGGMLGLFCLLLILAMSSTDSTRIFLSANAIAQDVVLPFCKNGLSPEKHVRIIRIASVMVGVAFMAGSYFLAQLDYINLFTTIVVSMWIGGCGPVITFGLYSRFGTTRGAWASLLSGMFLALWAIYIQRNWSNAVYPFIESSGCMEFVGTALSGVTNILEPYVVWKLNPVSCPVNSYEFSFVIMIITLLIYVTVSLIDGIGKEKFNLERMLHRGKYNLDGEKKERLVFSWRKIFDTFIGITPEYTTGDKVIAWAYFTYVFIYSFVIAFVGVIIWNAITPWPIEWWGYYFLIVSLIVPAIISFVATFWFGIGGAIGLYSMFKELENRTINPLDNGMVSGHMSLADKDELENIDR